MSRTRRKLPHRRTPPPASTRDFPLNSSDRFMHACLGKQSYPTRQAAARAARWHKNIYHHQERVYRCSICGQYHTTTHHIRQGGQDGEEER